MKTADNELIISMQRFKGMLKDVQCGEKTVLKFNDNASFQTAIRAWGWVNEDETHKFILVADWPTCGPSDQLQPYYITDADYDEQNFIAYLTGTEKTWAEVAHTFDINYGTARLINTPVPANGSTITKRWGPSISYDKSLTMDLTSDLNGKVYSDGTFGSSGFAIDIESTNTGTKGSITMTGKISVSLTSIKEVNLEITPKDVSASMGLSVHAEGYSGIAISYGQTLAKVPVPGLGWSIPGVFTIGLVVKAKVGFGMKNWNGSATMAYGVTASIPNDSTFKIDLANQNDNSFTGWKPTVTESPFTFNGQASADADVFTAVGLALEVSVLEQGFSAALQLKAPDFIFGLGIEKNDAGVCGTNKTLGVSIDGAMGASIGFSVGKDGGPWSISEPVKRSSDLLTIDAPRAAPRAEALLDAVDAEMYAAMESRGLGEVEKRAQPPSFSFSKTLWKGEIPLFSKKCFAFGSEVKRSLLQSAAKRWSGPGRRVRSRAERF